MFLFYFITSLFVTHSLYVPYSRRSYPPPNPEAAKSILHLQASGNTYKPYSFLGFSGTAGYSVVNQTTGSALFYWQVNKLGLDINTDKVSPTPLVIWLEGGPGCASDMAVLEESGPWYVNVTTRGLEVRNQTWAQDYHLLYIDAPTGVGFSVLASEDEYIDTSQQYAQQVYTALQGMAEDHSSWFMPSRPLFLFGESYAGHWVPALGALILKENAQIAVTGNLYLPLAGAGIGDAWTDPINQIVGNADFAYAVGLINEEQRTNLSYYEQMSVASLNAGFLPEAAHNFNAVLDLLIYFTGDPSNNICGINIYNYREYCDYDFNHTIWLTNSTNTALLGIPANVLYNDCNMALFHHMVADTAMSVAADVVYMLQSVPMMLYTGQDDANVNIIVGENWLANLDWPGQEGYLNAPKYPWKVDDQVVGFARTYDKLTQVTVMKAGHLVVHDQCANSRDMLSRFISGKGFTD